MSLKKVDVLLVGAGVMSATLGKLLAQLDPSLKIMMVERLSRVAHESSHGLNNAGTGHAGYCELNYTPEQADGSVDIRRALAINAAYEVSLQFWSYLVESGVLPEPEKFINPIYHQSFVWGEQNVDFLRKRYQALHSHHLFEEMEYSEDHAVLRKWMPLVMQHRDPKQPVAATQVRHGTDVDFGVLTRKLVKAMTKHDSFELQLGHTITGLKQHEDGRWHVRIKDNHSGHSKTVDAGFVFLGAGGGVLPLLQKSGIPEAQGYGGFPVSGQWLICKNPEVVKRHTSKVYGKAAVGAPPMSVPHLDARIIDGQPALLFGPFASITTRFLKQGSLLDMFSSIKAKNLKPMLAVARDNLELTRYLIAEAFRSHKDRVASLREFYADVKEKDWELASAGLRVQIIKGCDVNGGRLEFGTEIITAKDGTLAALLGASPGASTSVQAMIEVIERCFKSRVKSVGWQRKLKEMIPSYGESLDENVALLHAVRARTLATLGLEHREGKVSSAAKR
ncbi:MAG: malate dehydrogenase (quinone) [Nitrosomonadales bacterium]|nr:malate dehydrogenase (quinone) [Nitrosomonadales bacterium]